jgi:hypothetical protein
MGQNKDWVGGKKRKRGMEWAAGLERRRGQRFGFVFFFFFNLLLIKSFQVFKNYFKNF